MTKQSSLRTENLEVFSERIVSMMRDYNISLKEAVTWDMEGFDSYDTKNIRHISHYLVVNGLTEYDDRLFYLKVMNGEIPNIGLKVNNDASRD